MNGHTDAILMLAVVLVVLLFIEWALARRFAKHEIVEQRANAAIALSAEAAAATAIGAERHIRELREDVNAAKANVEALAENVRMHERRLGAIEERYMRAALLAPFARSKEEGNG